jgi:hypothetical protein
MIYNRPQEKYIFLNVKIKCEQYEKKRSCIMDYYGCRYGDELIIEECKRYMEESGGFREFDYYH